MSRTISKEEIEFRRPTAIHLNTHEEVRAFILGILSCASVYNFQPDAKMVAKCVRTEVPDDKDFVRTMLADLDDRGIVIAVPDEPGPDASCTYALENPVIVSGTYIRQRQNGMMRWAMGNFGDCN
jgi:hypothetical protein